MSNEVNQAFLRAYVKNRADRALQGTKPATSNPNSAANPPGSNTAPSIRRDIPSRGDSIRIDAPPQAMSANAQAHGVPNQSIPAPHLSQIAGKQRAPELNRSTGETARSESQGGVWSPIGVERGMKGTNRSNSAPAVVVNAPSLDSVPNVARLSSRTLSSHSPSHTASHDQPATSVSHQISGNRDATDESMVKLRVDAAHLPQKRTQASEIVVGQGMGNGFQVAPSVVLNDHLANFRESSHSNSMVPNAPIIAGAGIVHPSIAPARVEAAPSATKTSVTNASSAALEEPSLSMQTRKLAERDTRPVNVPSKHMPQHGDIHTAERKPAPKLPSNHLANNQSDRPETDYSPIDRGLDRHIDRNADRIADRSSNERVAASSTLPLPVAFAPSWEVDRFVWPAVLSQIEKSDQAAFQAISKHLRMANQDGLKVIAVTSGERGVGRSTVAMHLARSAAAAGLKVALIDADGFYPSLIDQLKIDLDHGWQECLFENIPLEEVAIKSIEDNVTLFPLTAVIPTQQLHVNLHRMAKIVKRISLAYDMVFLDSNRLNLEQRDLIGVSQERIIDAAIVVTDSELSVKEKVDTAVSILHGMGIASVGIVQNFHS